MIYVLTRKKKEFYGDENYQLEIMFYTTSHSDAVNWYHSSTQDEERNFKKVNLYQGV
jgi:hypothetical protein